ncbi:hypothetical protein OPV22_004378 [Ensete ventricosum]|uniref:Uncharacterized protein n=1 Tax=Ensete ventricosum TaxID=4639 RepID=A0AAV8S3N0_ENSVE|nr:hypothetical protein OPV22_004378 [Ensete ventricosum]
MREGLITISSVMEKEWNKHLAVVVRTTQMRVSKNKCQNSQVVWFIIAAPRLVQRNKEQTTPRKGYDKLGGSRERRREMGNNSSIHSLAIIPTVDGGAVVFAAVNGDGDGDGDGHRAVRVAMLRSGKPSALLHPICGALPTP